MSVSSHPHPFLKDKTVHLLNPSAWSTVQRMLCSHHLLLCSAMCYMQTATCASTSCTVYELLPFCLICLLDEGPVFPLVCILTTSTDFHLVNCFLNLSIAGAHPKGCCRAAVPPTNPPNRNLKTADFIGTISNILCDWPFDQTQPIKIGPWPVLKSNIKIAFVFFKFKKKKQEA